MEERQEERGEKERGKEGEKVTSKRRCRKEGRVRKRKLRRAQSRQTNQAHPGHLLCRAHPAARQRVTIPSRLPCLLQPCRGLIRKKSKPRGLHLTGYLVQHDRLQGLPGSELSGLSPSPPGLLPLILGQSQFSWWQPLTKPVLTLFVSTGA